MSFIALTVIAVLVIIYWLSKRYEERQRLAENEVRATLGLPPLTPGEFELKVKEKSADFRSNINQHM